KCIVSTSWYSPAGTADDWITSPSFVVPAGNPFLIWEEYAPDAQYADGYEVRISTTGNTTADFTTTLYSTPSAGSSGFTYKTVGLNAYIGQSVRVAFRNNSNDKFLLYLDNIEVANLSAGADASITGVTLNAIMGSTDKIGFTLRNEGGAAITSVSASYAIDGGTPVVQNFTSLNLGTFNSTELQFTTPVGSLSAGSHNVAITITQVNGGADPNAANNNGTGSFIAPTGSEQRNCLIEEFTSSTCVPCANFNVTFDPLILSQNANDNGSNFNIIKYQMNWPAPGNDVSYNPDGAARQNYYGVNAIPDHLTNGQTGGNGDAAEISACKTPVSFVSMTGSYLVKGGSVDSVVVSVTLTPRFTISGGNYSLRVALIEDHYTNNGATTTQKEYYHVMRKMLPNANGTPIANLTAGTPQTFTFKYKYNEGGVAQGNYNFWGDPAGGHMVAFLQDEDNGDVMQSVAVRGQHPASVNNV